MIELVDTVPEINVQPSEYKRLLGFPRDHVMDGRARELSDWARDWYARHGKPWIYARQSQSLAYDNGSIRIDGASFHSTRLQSTLQQPNAESVVLVAVSAGPEIEVEAQRLWREEKPDEYFFLEIYGSAVVEYLVTLIGSRLCNWAERNEMAVLPHYSPGYRDWDISEQNRLLELMRHAGRDLPSDMQVLESGMLRPKKSLLAVFGLTRQRENVRRLSDLVPCENCSLPRCDYRRKPYTRAPESSRREAPWSQTDVSTEPEDVAPPPTPALDRSARYVTSLKALRRWADDRLKLVRNDNGSIDAWFHYEGSTCSNMGRTIRFDYHVKLSSRESGYLIQEQSCEPTPGDDGYTRMCRYMNNAEHLMVAIAQEKPLAGQPLNEVLSLQRPMMAASCYCEPVSRKHKWGLVLETIHFALVQREQHGWPDDKSVADDTRAAAPRENS